MLSNATNQTKSTVELGYMCPRGLMKGFHNFSMHAKYDVSIHSKVMAKVEKFFFATNKERTHLMLLNFCPILFCYMEIKYS